MQLFSSQNSKSNFYQKWRSKKIVRTKTLDSIKLPKPNLTTITVWRILKANDLQKKSNYKRKIGIVLSTIQKVAITWENLRTAHGNLFPSIVGCKKMRLTGDFWKIGKNCLQIE